MEEGELKMYAKVAAMYVKAYCMAVFGSEPEAMESTMCRGEFLDAFDIVGTGSHKYIPKEMLNNDLNLPDGAGVYGYAKFSDDSYLLFTCPGKVAYWSGKPEEGAAWPQIKSVT